MCLHCIYTCRFLLSTSYYEKIVKNKNFKKTPALQAPRALSAPQNSNKYWDFNPEEALFPGSAGFQPAFAQNTTPSFETRRSPFKAPDSRFQSRPKRK